MKTLTTRRWLVIAWILYFLFSLALYGGIVWWAYHTYASVNLSPLRFVIFFQVLVQVVLAILISWFVGKAVLKPLAAMSRSARQIAGGDLNFSLPPSQVREVAEVAAAFAEMGGALRVALARQADLEQQRRIFISAIAHDLRTPLFSLRGYLEGLDAGIAATPEKVAHYVAVCREKASDLERRVTDLFAYARLEYMEQLPRLEILDFPKLLDSVIESFRPQLEAKGIELKLSGAPGESEIKGDASLLTRLFENLLDNAICYTGRAIWLDWECTGGKVHFRLADDGPGLAPQDLPYLFEPSYRGATAHLRQSGGAGLGLTIARRILIAHGGGLEASNRAEGGAVFEGNFRST